MKNTMYLNELLTQEQKLNLLTSNQSMILERLKKQYEGVELLQVHGEDIIVVAICRERKKISSVCFTSDNYIKCEDIIN